jgi:hypothetical protein
MLRKTTDISVTTYAQQQSVERRKRMVLPYTQSVNFY